MPRLNSLNHEPGVSFGQLDILTYQKQNEKRVNECATALISEQRFVNMVNDAASKTPFKITRLLHEHLSYPCGFLIWVDARFSTCGEVAEHFDGVSCAALIWINPVFTWETETSVTHNQSGGMRTALAFMLLMLKKRVVITN